MVKRLKLAISSLIILCIMTSCGTADVDTFTPVPGYTDNFYQDSSLPDTSQDGEPTPSQDVLSTGSGLTNSEISGNPDSVEPSSNVTNGIENPKATENNSTGTRSASIPSTESSGVSSSANKTQASSVKTPFPTVNKTPTSTVNSGVYIPAPGTYNGTLSIKTAKTSETQVTNNGATIDTGNTSQGYIMVKKTSSTKTKVVVTGPGGQTYQNRYLIPSAGTFYPIPLQMGNGSYTIMIAQNTTGDSYSVLVKTTVSVTISSDYTLIPNIFVNYNASSTAVKKAFDLCVNAKSDLECTAAIYNFITTNIKYDNDKAKTVTSGYIPNPDDTLKTKKGICFDYASLMAAMLRAKGIPTRLVIGKADGNDHSWNEVYIKNIGWIAVEIKSNGGWKLLDSTFGTDYTGSRIDKVKYTSTEYY